MRVLITGGAGDIGAYVVGRLKHAHDVTVLDVREPRVHRDVRFVQVDLTDLEATVAVVRQADVVVHLAAIPHPFCEPHDRVMHVNTVSTFNVLEAMRRNGIARVVYGSSESATGFGIHNVEHRPLYVPIDEEHPCWPHEPYSLSKYFGEQICAEYARAYGIEAIALRYCWVWLARNGEQIPRAIAAAQREDARGFFAFISPEDVAEAFGLSLAYRFPAGRPPFEAFLLCAERTYAKAPTLELLRRMYGQAMPEVRKPQYFEANPHAPVFDITKAKRCLGFRPRSDWRRYAEGPVG